MIYCNIKLLLRYIYKGHDRASFALAKKEGWENDEIRLFWEGYSYTTPEAFWRLYAFPLHYKTHDVVALPVHAENMHQVKFSEDDDVETILQEQRFTKLNAFFTNNAKEFTREGKTSIFQNSFDN